MISIRKILFFQAVYYFITGLWPILNIKSFMEVTGPKADIWLVKTVGFLILSISFTLATAVFKSEIKRQTIVLAISSAIFLAGIDIYYSMENIISRIYLGDAFIQLVLIAAVIIKRPQS
jgi:hypothetical protein